MPTWKKSPPELVERFRGLVANLPEATQRPMFGYPTCVVSGHMFVGLHEDHLILRLPEDDRRRFVDVVGGAIFEPMAGRPMREYVVAPTELVDDPAIDEWIARAYAYARTLPVKVAKPPKAKAATRKRDRAAS